METSQGGFFERTQGHMHPVVIADYGKRRMDHLGASSGYLLKVMAAHAVMLAQCAIIPRPAAAALARTLARWAAEGGIAQERLDPALEDLYINMEHLLAEELGPEVSGHLPVARSRNDVEAAMWRIEAREKLAALADELLRHVAVLGARAAATADAVMPAYTYDQQAQPATLGFTLSAYSAALLRDAERVLDCVRRLDHCPLGAAAATGTGYPIDRALTARLLGFAGVLDHAGDCVSAADYMLEGTGAAVLALNTLARLAEDVIKWCLNETGFADLPDSLIDSSSIMPQKRNPVIVAAVRANARLMIGRYAGMLAACTVPYEASRDVTIVWEETTDCLSVAAGMCRISQAYLAEMTFHLEDMEQSLARGFTNTTEIADTLVREGGLPFRHAHQIVGGAVADLFAQGKGPEAMTYELLNQWSHTVCGAGLPIAPATLAAAAENRNSVTRRHSFGGTAPAEVRRMVKVQDERRRELGLTLESFRNRWSEADRALQDACAAL
jgi:argininosuccinate lyase